MKRLVSILLCGLMIMGLLSGCGSTKNNTSDNPKETKESQEDAKSEDSQEPVELKVWHDANEDVMKVIETYVNEKLKADNVSVKFEKKSGLTDQIKLYGNDEENGPDLYFYAHDSLGMFVEMGVLAPITDIISADQMSELLPMTVKACTYKEAQYLLPVYFETLLMLYNKDLWKGDIPSTTEDLYNYMVENTDSDNGTYAVVNQHSTAYNVSPFINGFGGYLLSEDGKAGLNDAKTKEAVTYNKKFAVLQADGDYNTVTTLFNEGKAQAIIGGPWLVSGIKDAKINMGVKSLSEITLPNGEALAPYAGIQGIGVLKHAAENKKDAVAKVLSAILDSELGVELATTSNCAPANQKAYDNDDVKSNEMITAMGKTADTAQPMPNIPAVSVIWTPAEAFLAAVNKSGEEVDSAADQYQAEAETAIEDIQ